MNRREFGTKIILAGAFVLASPLLTFGEKLREKLSFKNKADKWSHLSNLNIKVTHEEIFERYLKLDKSKQILNTPVRNTVYEVITDKKTGKRITYEEKLNLTISRSASWYYRNAPWERKYSIGDFDHKVYLVNYMSIEFEYSDNSSYYENKHKAMLVLSHLFDKAVERGIVIEGVLMPCVSLKLVQHETNIYREMLMIWPVASNVADLKMSHVDYFNDQLRAKAFCCEGEMPRMLVDVNGKVRLAKDHFLKGAIEQISDRIVENRGDDKNWSFFESVNNDKLFLKKKI